MRDFIRKHQRTIGIIFIGIAFVLFADKAIDLGADAVPLLGEIMVGVILFAVGYAFVFHNGQTDRPKPDKGDD